jgi:hypothetical protein
VQREAPAGRDPGDPHDPGEYGKLPINGLENFPGYAKGRLKAYHAGFERNFQTHYP